MGFGHGGDDGIESGSDGHDVHSLKQVERGRDVAGAAVDCDHGVPNDRVSLGTLVEKMAGGGGGYAFAVQVDECGGDEGVGEETELGEMGVDGEALAREVESGAGLEGEGEDEGVEGEVGRGAHTVEEGECLVVAVLVDVRLQELGY